ncbi:MAG: hypothetical protein WDZ90_00975 [Candidatus Paceibacterota bacterium]
MRSFEAILDRIIELLINPLIALLFAVALAFFLWGGVQFLINPAEAATREQGKRHLLWGIVGMAIMVGVFGILRILAGTFGFDIPNN